LAGAWWQFCGVRLSGDPEPASAHLPSRRSTWRP
jgi:hypothetical protein